MAAGQCRVEVILCSGCGHIWNDTHEESENSLYNDDYYSSFTSSEQARQYQESLAVDLDRLISLKGKSVVEIGCGDGFFLKALSSLGAKATGFEPSSTFQVATKQPGISVHHEYFDFAGDNRTKGRVDIVVLRHVLEHMPNAQEVLSSLATHSFVDSRPQFLMIEVPNALHLLQENLYFDFYNDHVHYFSYASLSRLLERSGWIVVANLGDGGEFIRVVFKNANAGSDSSLSFGDELPPVEPQIVVEAAKRFQEDFSAWKDDLTDIIDSQYEKGRSMAVWGAGARGVSLLCGSGVAPDCLASIVDSDANKHGRFLPVIHLPVDTIDQFRKYPSDCVLVTSYTYFDEIYKQLDWYRASGGQVIRVYPSPELV